MEAFIEHIKQYIHLSAEAEEAILQTALLEEVPKGHIILKEGKTCKRMYFLLSGTVRIYFYQKGKDITHWIYPDQMSFTSWGSFLLRKPAAEYIEVIEDATLVSLSYDDWQELYLKFPELERYGRLTVEEQMGLIDDFYKGYYFLTAKEKYDLLIEVYPSIIQRANLGYIASMLGISQETLSRIRGK
jgi:CRP-like cAMP-binding protein